MEKALWAKVVERDRGRCFLCGGEGGEVHHVVPRSHYGKKTREFFEHERNLMLLCRQCHRNITIDSTPGQLLQKLRDKFHYDYGPEFQPWLRADIRIAYWGI